MKPFGHLSYLGLGSFHKSDNQEELIPLVLNEKRRRDILSYCERRLDL